MNKTKIALGDLRHKTVGRHSVFMPLGIGYIASYTLMSIGADKVEIRLYTDPDSILGDIDKWKPEVVGLSNYCWNSELSKNIFAYTRKVKEDIVCVAGGPDFPIGHAECEEYLLKRPEIDFYINYEGEIAFCQLVEKIQQNNVVNTLKSKPHDGIMSVHPKTGNLVAGNTIPRQKDMDYIPSPYLSGLMDQWFDGSYAPSIETARGCPFSCGFCFTGQSWYSSVATFSTERIKKELSYIAHRIRKYPNVLLSICDSNFGMFERDEEIADHIRDLQDNYNWPNAFDVTTGKKNYDRILRVATRLKNRMHITCSLQSTNPETIKIIKRKNPLINEYKMIQNEIKNRGMLSLAELIIPLPMETKSSFFKGVETLINADVDAVVPYTTMMLKGTYLASKGCRSEYGLQTKYRLLPRQFGEYKGTKCFEVEEVCIATNTMSFEDYLECRGFALISSIFSDKQYDIIRRHLKEIGISNYDYLCSLWELIKSGENGLSTIYNRYLKESSAELFDSKDELPNYYSKQENYDRLLMGGIGDNLIRKYKTTVFLKMCVPSIEAAYTPLEKMSQHLSTDIQDSLHAAKRWVIALRNISSVFKNESLDDIFEILQLSYDVNAWYHSERSSRSLVSFKKTVKYRLAADTKRLKGIFEEGRKLYGEDVSYRSSKILINWSVKDFWYKCEPL